MKPRELAREVISTATAHVDLVSLQQYADTLAADVGEAAKTFCQEIGLGPWVEQLLIENDVSVPFELYGIIQGRERAANQSIKEVIDTSEKK